MNCVTQWQRDRDEIGSQNEPLKYGVHRRRKSLARVLRGLERQEPFNALWAAIVLLREAHNRGEHAQAFTIGGSIYRTMLIACATSPGFSIGEELVLAIAELVLPLASSQGCVHASCVGDVIEQSRWLLVKISRLEDDMQIGMFPTDTWDAASRILRGEYGDHLRFGMRPRLALDRDVAMPSLETRVLILWHDTLRSWGWDVLKRRDVERFVPLPVVLEIKSKAQQLRDDAEQCEAIPE
jgi:hypothetical protein